MNAEQEKLKTIYVGYHPRANDGSPPQLRSLNESIAAMDSFNKSQEEGRFRAEVFEIAYSDLYTVGVWETKIGKIWQYI